MPDRGARVFEVGSDALVYVLAAIVMGRVLLDGGPLPALAAALAVGVAVVHGVGTALGGRHGRAAQLWFAGSVAVWIALVAVDVAGVYLAFGLFFVALDRFPTRAAVGIVAAMTAVTAVAELVHQPSLGIASVIGPGIGAVVAVAMGLGYRSLEHENEQRRALIAELHQAQADLAAAEHARGVLEERERLAREIHDTVAQGLASIVILLGATDQELRAGHVDAAIGHVDQARSTARTNLDEARRFVRALAPPALDGATLEQALQQLAAASTAAGGPEVTAIVSGPPRPLPALVEVALLRVAQSALANMAAHAEAGHGQITLSYLPDEVSLDIHDDGRGFDPGSLGAAPRGDGGFGLVAMRQRVDALGGTFTVETAPGEGTVIAVNLPAQLPAAPAGATEPPAVGEPPVPIPPRSPDDLTSDPSSEPTTDPTTDPASAPSSDPTTATTADVAGRSVAGTRP